LLEVVQVRMVVVVQVVIKQQQLLLLRVQHSLLLWDLEEVQVVVQILYSILSHLSVVVEVVPVAIHQGLLEVLAVVPALIQPKLVGRPQLAKVLLAVLVLVVDQINLPVVAAVLEV
jgi:hypothetical protein